MTFSQSRSNPQIKLSPEEMLEISQEIKREFAPSFSIKKQEPASQHKLSRKEMFAISEEISHDFSPKPSNNTQKLVILPVDPNHLHVYWNLGDNQMNSVQKNDSGNQLTLRIYLEPGPNTDSAETKSYFDVAIESTQAQQKVFLPMRTDETAFHASIGKCYSDNSLAPIACSNTAHVPLGKQKSHQVKENQIVFKPTPQLITANRKTSLSRDNSASGQGNN